MEAGQSVGSEAFPPLADGVSVAVEFLGKLLVGRVVVVGGVEDEAAAEGQGLRGGSGLDERVDLLTELG